MNEPIPLYYSTGNPEEMVMFDLDKHAGQKLIAIDIRAGTSPAAQAIVPVSASARAIVARMSAELQAVVEKHLPGCVWSLGRPITVSLSRRSGYILPKAERRRRDEARREAIGAIFQASDAIRAEARESDPHNGSVGWWRVDGVRHSAIARAASADEALEKAGVDSWESPSVEWIGETLPDVIEC